MVTEKTPAALWGDVTARSARLEMGVVLLALAVLLLGGAHVWRAVQGTPVYFVPPGGPGLARPGTVPDGAAIDYASRWLERRYTFTPATATVMQRDILATLHPTLTTAFHAQVEREALLIKEKKVAAQVAVLSTAVAGRSGLAVTVTVQALRSVFVGGAQVKDEDMRAEITVMPWPVHGPPEGLVVTKVSLTPPLTSTP
jgi:hypothetical protein